MDDMIICALLLSIALPFLYLLMRTSVRENKGKPVPGPSLIEGILTFIKGSRANNFHLYVAKWAERYGDIVQVNLLLRRAVFINDAETFRKLVKDADFRDFTNDRPTTFFGKFYLNGCNDITFATFYGPDLRKKRKTLHNVVKFYGEGKSQFEELMLKSLEELKQEFLRKDTVELSNSIKNYIRNLVGFLLDGNISVDSKRNLEILRKYSENAERIVLFENETFLQPFPFLRLVPGLRFKSIHDTIVADIEKMYGAYFYPLKNTFDPDIRRGIVDDLLVIQQENEKAGSDFLNDDLIKAIILDLVPAAYLTTSSLLSSLFLILIKNPDIQERIYDEIQRIIGDSVPAFHHRPQMPFTEAAILETLRYSSNIPQLLPHMVRQDIVYDGYFIPKSTILMMNAWHCHHREDYWDDPFTFKPERFLDNHGQLVDSSHAARQRMIPFGTGGRGCPGEMFGKSRAFLVTVFLVQNFQFVPDENVKLPSSDPREWEGVTVLCPDNYSCMIRPRSV